MFKRTFFWILIIVAVAGSVAGMRLVLSVRKSIEPAQPVAPPSSAPFAEAIGARGIIESVDENVRIAPAIAALVIEIPVKVGQEVKAGDILVRQDNREAESMVGAQEAEIAALHAQIHEAEIAVADKRDMWERMEKLSATKVASDEEKKRTMFASQIAEAQLESTKAKIASAEATLQRTKVQRDLLVTRAPRDGQVLQVNTRAGEFAAPADKDPMILLGQVNTLQLRADVDEDNASKVRKGMKAVAYLKGHRETGIPLVFERIEPFILPKKSLSGDSSERVDTRVLQIIYRFDRPKDLSLYVGQQMDVFLDGAKAGDRAETMKTPAP